MFRSFFLSREWALWAWGGMAIIVGGTWYQVQVDVQINEWFGQFYDAIQQALGEPGARSPQSNTGVPWVPESRSAQ